jgi:hypothetical protein
VPGPETFSPAVNERIHQLLAEVLGPVWNEIQARDARGRSANPPNPRRHLLVVLSEHADLWADESTRGIWPGHAPDYLAFHGVVAIMERSRSDPAFAEILTQLVTPEGFRHHMTLLGFADHISRHTPYPVRLTTAGDPGQRVVDLVLGPMGGHSFQVEIKTPREFDGPVVALTRSNALGALSRAWAGSVGGQNPQLPPDRPGILLLGGLTMRVESLPVFDEAARDWLSHHGRSHPFLWGVVSQTFWTYSLTPPGRTLGDGAPLTIDGRMGVRLQLSENPHYTGTPRLAPAPYAPD